MTLWGWNHMLRGEVGILQEVQRYAGRSLHRKGVGLGDHGLLMLLHQLRRRNTLSQLGLQDLWRELRKCFRQ